MSIQAAIHCLGESTVIGGTHCTIAGRRATDDAAAGGRLINRHVSSWSCDGSEIWPGYCPATQHRLPHIMGTMTHRHRASSNPRRVSYSMRSKRLLSSINSFRVIRSFPFSVDASRHRSPVRTPVTVYCCHFLTVLHY